VKGAKRSIEPRNDGFTAGKTTQDFDISRTGNACGDGHESDPMLLLFIFLHDVDALEERGLRAGSSGGWLTAGFIRGLTIIPCKGLFCRGISLYQRLDGDGEGIGTARGGDLRGGGEAWAEFIVSLGGAGVRGCVDGDDNLEVLGLLRSGSGHGSCGQAERRPSPARTVQVRR
jgi:hypothetical protein